MTLCRRSSPAADQHSRRFGSVGRRLDRPQTVMPQIVIGCDIVPQIISGRRSVQPQIWVSRAQIRPAANSHAAGCHCRRSDGALCGMVQSAPYLTNLRRDICGMMSCLMAMCGMIVLPSLGGQNSANSKRIETGHGLLDSLNTLDSRHE